MEKTQKSGEGVKTTARLAEEAAEKRERMDRLDGGFLVKPIIRRLNFILRVRILGICQLFPEPLSIL